MSLLLVHGNERRQQRRTRSQDRLSDCRLEETQKPQCRSKTHSRHAGRSSDIHRRNRLLPEALRPQLRSRCSVVLAQQHSCTAGFLFAFFIVCFLLGPASAAAGTSAPAITATILRGIVNTTQLARLCRLDATAGGCASRFYLSKAQSETDPLPDYDRRLFEHLLALFIRENTHLPPTSGNGTEKQQLEWWLYITRFARHCNGLPNRIYVLDRGCRCLGRPESCLEPAALNMGWEYASFNILACLLSAAVIYSMYSTIDQYRQTKRIIAPLLERNAQQSPPQQANIVVMSPNVPAPLLPTQQQQPQDIMYKL